MPTFLLKNTTDSSLSLLSGDIPLDTSGLVPEGSYEVHLLSDPAGTVLIVAGGNNTAKITAIDTPQMSALYEGQSVRDVAGYAAMVSTDNFTSDQPGEVIQTISVTFQGAPIPPVDEITVLLEGDTAGFTLEVVGSQGTTAQYVTPPVAIQYAARWVDAGNQTYDLDINPLVADDVEVIVDIDIDGVNHQYGFSRSDILGGPVLHQTPSFSLYFDSTTVGSAPLLTSIYPANDGDGGAIAMNYTLRSDGVTVTGYEGISEEALLAYRITANEQGTDLDVEVSLSDTNGTRAYNSAAVAIPGTSGEGLTPVYHASGFHDTQANIHRISALDLSTHADTDPLYILLGSFWGGGASSKTHATVNIAGVEARYIGASDTGTPDAAKVEVWKVPAQALAETGDLVVTSNSQAYVVGASVYSVPGATLEEVTGRLSVAATVVDISANVSVGDALITGGMNINGSAISFNGMPAPDFSADIRSSEFFSTAMASVTVPASPQSISADHATPAVSAAVAVVIS